MLQLALHHQQAALLHHAVVAFPHRREHHQIHFAELVLNGDKSHILVLFCQDRLNTFDQSTDGNLAVCFDLSQLIGAVADLIGDLRHV